MSDLLLPAFIAWAAITLGVGGMAAAIHAVGRPAREERRTLARIVILSPLWPGFVVWAAVRFARNIWDDADLRKVQA